MVTREGVLLNKLGIILGVIILLIATGTAPMPYQTILQSPVRIVVLYPNLLFAVPLILLGILLLLYGITVEENVRGANP